LTRHIRSDPEPQMRVIRWAIAQTGLAARPKLVLVTLAAACNDGATTVTLSKARLAEQTSMDRKSVSLAITTLRQRGLVHAEHTTADDGGTLANRYHLAIDPDAASASPTQTTGQQHE